MMNIKLRYKQPGAEVSKLISHAVADRTNTIQQASENLRFAAAVAQFGMLLRNSAFKGSGNMDRVYALAKSAMGSDGEGYRKEFLQLVTKAKALNKKELAANVIE